MTLYLFLRRLGSEREGLRLLGPRVLPRDLAAVRRNQFARHHFRDHLELQVLAPLLVDDALSIHVPATGLGGLSHHFEFICDRR